MLEVRLLGTFEVTLTGKSIDIPSRPAQSLFAYLTLNGGISHRREKLAGLLWPDSLEETARENLRHALWRLRKALKTASATHFLQADDLTLKLETLPEYSLDAAELEGLSESAASDELMLVLSNYQGELLPGFYDEWVVLRREHLNAVFEHQMARLMALLQQETRWLDVLEWAERWIKFGQKPEPAYRALMTAHAAKGDMSKVAATYERCLKSLKEYGFEPSPQTQALYQMLKSGRESFNPGSTVPTSKKRHESPKINVPVPITSFIGREQDVGEIIKLLVKNRLLTLTGPGGVGKTRLAIQAAHGCIQNFHDGVFWVGLVGLPDENSIPHAMAQSLDVREASNVPLIATLKKELAQKSLLLVLDNCEHLIDAVAQMAEQLLDACPALKILTTSRERIGIFNEMVWRVRSLSEEASHQLFLERAQSSQHDFSLTKPNRDFVGQICERLDRIPLAIELAAARVAFLSVEEIAGRLDDRFSLLTSGSRTALAHQQTLLTTMDWSHDLLTEPERVLFRRLSIFVNGFTLEAVEAVCSDDELKRRDILNLLGRLVDKSLVTVEAISQVAPTRYRFLETIREYASEKLTESDEETVVRDRHMEYFSQLAIEAEPNLLGAESFEWVDRLEAEHDNLLAAIDWSLHSENADFALSIVGALTLWDAWHNSEGAERSLQVVRSPLTHKRTPLRAKALNTAGGMQWFQRNVVQARSFFEEAIAIGKESNVKEFHYVWSLATMGNIDAAEGNYATAQAYLEEALAAGAKLGARGTVAMGYSLALLGDVYTFQGDREKARPAYEESVTRLRELNNRNFLDYPLRRLAELALDRAEYEQATSLYKESLSLNLAGGDQRAVVASLAGFAAVATARGQVVPAIQLYGAVESLLNAISATLTAADQHLYDHNVALLRSQLGEADFNAAWSQGQTMTMERAIEFVLSETKS